MQSLKLSNMIITFFTFLAMSLPAGAEPCGQIEQIKGTVEVHRLKTSSEDVRTAVKVDRVPFPLDCTDVVMTLTHSAARIRLGSAVMSLSANTRLAASVQSKTSEGSWLELSFGKVRTFFKGKSENKKGAFRISTPVAVVGVRGTDFFASFDPNDFEMRQATLVGEVMVSHKQTKQELPVKAGQQAIARPTEEIKDLDKSIPKPKALIYSDASEALKVSPMDESTKIKVRESSELAKKVNEFETKEAIKVIGPSDKWITVDPSEVPEDLKEIKNEF